MAMAGGKRKRARPQEAHASTLASSDAAPKEEEKPLLRFAGPTECKVQVGTLKSRRIQLAVIREACPCSACAAEHFTERSALRPHRQKQFLCLHLILFKGALELEDAHRLSVLPTSLLQLPPGTKVAISGVCDLTVREGSVRVLGYTAVCGGTITLTSDEKDGHCLEIEGVGPEAAKLSLHGRCKDGIGAFR